MLPLPKVLVKRRLVRRLGASIYSVLAVQQRPASAEVITELGRICSILDSRRLDNVVMRAVIDDCCMSRRRRVAPGPPASLWGLALLALGMFVEVGGLDRADRAATFVGTVVGICAVAVSVYGAVQTRHTPTPTKDRPSVIP